MTLLAGLIEPLIVNSKLSPQFFELNIGRGISLSQLYKAVMILVLDWKVQLTIVADNLEHVALCFMIVLLMPIDFQSTVELAEILSVFAYLLMREGLLERKSYFIGVDWGIRILHDFVLNVGETVLTVFERTVKSSLVKDGLHVPVQVVVFRIVALKRALA